MITWIGLLAYNLYDHVSWLPIYGFSELIGVSDGSLYILSVKFNFPTHAILAFHEQTAVRYG